MSNKKVIGKDTYLIGGPPQAYPLLMAHFLFCF